MDTEPKKYWPERYWLVWRRHGPPPTKFHFSEVEAKQESERLAKKHPGQFFYVFETVARCRKSDIEWEELR